MFETLVICSGYFNPIHKGHIEYLQEAKKLGTKLFVIVNSDFQVDIKRSIPFMEEEERLEIVKNIKCVDYATISVDRDGSVCSTVAAIHSIMRQLGVRNFIFANGGDRKEDNIPEYEICEKLNIIMSFNVGGEKTQSSSTLISKAAKHD
jgi:D-beta-D-heptose 7-phosphate kinase/D-beta-D-heptose 1-phosphate adenosyltransferase